MDSSPPVIDGEVLPPSTATVSVPIDSIFPDPANVRLHPEKNIKAVMASIERFGQRTPITIDADRIIRKGNGTWEAMKRLGRTHVDVAPWDSRGSEATAYSIADNRTAELAEWDYEPLAFQLAALRDEGWPLPDLGWERHEYEPLLLGTWEKPQIAEGSDSDSFVTHGKPIACTVQQRDVFMRAVDRIRVEYGEDITEGRCLELLSASYLSGPSPDGMLP